MNLGIAKSFEVKVGNMKERNLSNVDSMGTLKADLHGTIFVTIVTKIRDNTCAVTKSVFF